LKFKRLPLQWLPPQLAETLSVKESVVRLASESGHYLDETVKSHRTEEGRVIGTLVHLWLERISSDGLNCWPQAAIKGQVDNFKAQLNINGVPHARLENCAAIILTCLINATESERGRWLLGHHQEAASELALNGMIEGQLVRATIDRTFIDSDGVRWIVDYKTSRPVSGEGVDGFMSPDEFMIGEEERYRSQLQLYATLIRQLEENRPLRTALYFPMFDGWIEQR